MGGVEVEAKVDLGDDLKHHTRNLSTVLEGILRMDAPVKEKAKRIQYRCSGFLQCLESLVYELEVRENDRHQEHSGPA